jgi:VWFA-related protein
MMKAQVCMYAAMAAIVVMTGAVPIVSQMPAATGQASSQSAAEPVSLDLAVHDRHNKPVLDLKPEEISVTDNGKPAKLTDLRLVTGKQQDKPLITLLFDRPGMADSKKKKDDFLFGGSGSQAQANSRKLQQVATKFLRAFPSGGFQFAVVDVWGRLQIQQESSEDRKAITEAIAAAVEPGINGKKFTANAVEQRLAQVAKTGLDPKGKAADTRERTLARSMYAALETSSHIAKDQHLSLSQSCLMALVEAQQSLPGRKAVIYFAASQNATGDTGDRAGKDSHAQDALRSIVGAANRAGISIYVVLPNTLEDTDELAHAFNVNSIKYSSESGSADIFGGVNPTMGDLNTMAMAASSYAGTKRILAAQENMNMLARQTGGDVLNGSGSMSEPVKDIARNLTTYYEATFVPDSGVEDGSFHTTAFKTSRRGIRMRARTGYLALPPSAGISDPPQPFELPLMALLKQTELPGDVDYRAGVLRMGHRDEGNVSLLALEVPVSGLQVREDASTHLNSAHLSVFATIKDNKGTQIERFSEDIARRWAAGGSAGSAPDFISFERSFAAPPGKYVLETAILDNNGGKASARRQAFEIPSSQSLPELSDLIVVRGIEPAGDEGGEPDLLWGSEQRVEPNLYGQMPAGVHNVSVFLLAHTDAKLQEPATLNIEVLRDGTPLKGKPLTTTLKAGAEFAPVLKGFAINSAADGKYDIRATLTQGGKSAETAGTFELTGEEVHMAGGGAGAIADAPVAVDPPGLEAAEQAADRPTPEELSLILADVRKNALEYADSVPNLICQQNTTRSTDARGNGDWKSKDSIVEVLTYMNHEEDRTLVGGEVNHKQESAKDLSEDGMTSNGEFGVALSNIFKPVSKAEFTWKETGMLRGEAVEVFDYRIAQQNALFFLTVFNASAKVGYHGSIYIDRATRGVMSITMITDDVPKKFPILKAAIRVDYDYVNINDHDYLLPASAQVITKGRGNSLSGGSLRRNDITFSNYRRFGSRARIVGIETKDAPQ